VRRLSLGGTTLIGHTGAVLLLKGEAEPHDQDATATRRRIWPGVVTVPGFSENPSSALFIARFFSIGSRNDGAAKYRDRFLGRKA
jgi:hypothetical protein